MIAYIAHCASQRKWIVHVLVDVDELGCQHHKRFNVLSIDPNAEDEL